MTKSKEIFDNMRTKKVECLIQAVDSVCGTLWKQPTRRQEAVDARIIFAFLSRRHCNLTQAKISAYLNLCRTDISKLQHNAAIYMERDRRLREKMERVERELFRLSK